MLVDWPVPSAYDGGMMMTGEIDREIDRREFEDRHKQRLALLSVAALYRKGS